MQKRELWKVIVFGIITLGIYDLVWLYKTRNEMVAKGQKIPTIWLLLAPYLIMLVLLVPLFLLSGTSKNANPEDVGGGILSLILVIAVFLLTLATIPLAIYWAYKYSKAVEAVTKGHTTFGFTFGMAIVLNLFSVGFIWPALVQDGFNKMDSGEKPTVADTPYPNIGQKSV